MVNGERLILDEDRTWKASEAPFEPNPIPWLPHHLQPGYQPRQQAPARAAAPAPGLRYRGVYQKGQQYVPGDVVTRSGSMWYCQEPTLEQPPGDHWQLCVKAGRDGRDGKPGRKGDPGDEES